MSERPERPAQRPEGAVIERALKRKNLSARAAAEKAGISEGRWRQVMNGYQATGQGKYVDAVGTDVTVAHMAKAVEVTPEELDAAGRPDAALLLRDLYEQDAKPEGVEAELKAIRDNPERPSHLRSWAQTLLDQHEAIRQAIRAENEQRKAG